MVGSVVLRLVFLGMFQCTGKFDFIGLSEVARNGQLIPALAGKIGWHRLAPQQIALIIFCGAFLGFAVKVPLIPFHTWLPQAYAEAPSGTTMLLTGAMSKMGVYGFLRILFPIFYVEMRSARTPLLWLSLAHIFFSPVGPSAK